MLNKLPNLEERKQSQFFKTLCSMFKMSGEHDYHWLIYSMIKNTIFVSLIFTMISGVRLYLNQPLTEEFVSRELKIFTVGLSSIITFTIIPYYYVKCKKIIGFSNIDYLRVIRERTPLEMEYALRSISKFKWMTILMLLSLYLVWLPMEKILRYYDSLTDIVTVVMFMLVSGCVFMTNLGMVLIHTLLVYIQHTKHKNKIPSTDIDYRE